MKKKKPKLAELFKCQSVKQIVALLKRYGIRGKLNNGCDCPLSNFAKKCGVKKPSVLTRGCCKSFDAVYGHKIIFGESMIREKFIRRFDEGKLPELVA